MTSHLRLPVAVFVVLWSVTVAQAPDLRAGAAAPPPVYGEDGIQESAHHPDPRLRAMANSVAALVPQRDVRIRGNEIALGGETLADYVMERCGGPLCDGGRFRNQPTPAFCSGFLIESDLLVTAGHCIRNERVCQRTRFVFDFKMDDRGSVAPLERYDVFECQALVRRVNRRGVDFAVVRLDRDTGRPGLEMEADDVIGIGTPLALIGHPFGLPMKIAAGGTVVRPRSGDSVFETTLDALDSNSGSPVISTITYRVEGVLARGEEDFVETADGCFMLKQCPDDGSTCRLEDVVRMGVVMQRLP